MGHVGRRVIDIKSNQIRNPFAKNRQTMNPVSADSTLVAW
jgi:hypothetical protein